MPQLLLTSGLILTLIGSGIGAWSVRLSKDQALMIGLFHWSADTDEENLKLPAVKNLLQQSKMAQIGFMLIAAGTFLQIIGTLLS